jgi:hypothetical protein
LFRETIVALIVWKDIYEEEQLYVFVAANERRRCQQSREKEECVYERPVARRHGDERKLHDENEDERERMD